jgi:hypothetical protein
MEDEPVRRCKVVLDGDAAREEEEFEVGVTALERREFERVMLEATGASPLDLRLCVCG